MLIDTKIHLITNLNGWKARVRLNIRAEVNVNDEGCDIDSILVYSGDDCDEGVIYDIGTDTPVNKIKDFCKIYGIVNIYLDSIDRAIYDDVERRLNEI